MGVDGQRLISLTRLETSGMRHRDVHHLRKSVTSRPVTLRHIPDVLSLQQHRAENRTPRKSDKHWATSEHRDTVTSALTAHNYRYGWHFELMSYWPRNVLNRYCIALNNQPSVAQWLLIRTGQLKCDGTRAETRFRLSAERTSPFKSAGGGVSSVDYWQPRCAHPR